MGFESTKNCILPIIIIVFWLRIFGSKESGRDNVVIKMRFSLYFFSIFPGNQTDGRFALRGDTLKMLSLKVLNSRVYL